MALKTNSKEVNEKVLNYIIESFHDSDFEEWHGVHVTDTDTICTIVFNAFISEKEHLDLRFKAGRISEQDLFIEWAGGLPSILGCEYYYNVDAIKMLGDWLEQTETERNRYTESQAEETISKLIYRQLTRHGKRLPIVLKADIEERVGDYCHKDKNGNYHTFGCPLIGTEYNTSLYCEDIHFLVFNS